jgi:PAS domain S-box-containing protein
MFGYGREELFGKPIETLIPNRLRQRHSGERTQFLRQPQSRLMGVGRDLFARRKDGSEFPIEIGLSPVNTLYGNYVLASVVDITGRKGGEGLRAKHAADLEALNTELRLSNADLDAFAHMASHDLQEPLRTLSSYLALLREDLGPDINTETATDLHFIGETAKRMHSLVQDLLAFSRAGRKPLRRERVPLEQCVDEALLSLAARIQETRAEIRRGPLPEVAGDMTLLTQVYQNLLGNALKFTAAGERPVIDLAAELSGADYLLIVKDNGIGIEEQYAEQIFEPFKRLHARNVYPGSGVGLALCRRAIERHGGRIWVESQLGQGSRFVFALPRPGAELSQHSESSTNSTIVGR